MNENYIDNKKFEFLIKKYLENRENKKVEEKLFLLFDILIDNILGSFNFDLEQEDAKQECFLLIIKVLPNFNKSSGSAFNYFTTIILNNLKLMYTKRKKYNNKIEIYKQLHKDNILLDT